MFHSYLNTITKTVTKANAFSSNIFGIRMDNTGLHYEEKHLKFDYIKNIFSRYFIITIY